MVYVQWKTPDDGPRDCLKHVEFYSKNKFQKLVHLVGFIIRIIDLNLQSLQPECNPDSISRRTSYICLTFLTVQMLAFLPSSFQNHICECFNSSSCNFTINTNKNSVKHLQSINFLQLSLTKKTEIKNLSCNTRFSYFPVIIRQKTSIYEKI